MPARAGASSSAVEHRAVGHDALVDLEHALVEHLGQHDLAREDVGPVLVGDAQRVGEAARDHQQHAIALALEQRVGGDGGAHLDRLDDRRDRATRFDAQQLADAGDGGVAIALRVLGEQLVDDQRAVGPARDDVGEGAAAIDPELPAGFEAHGLRPVFPLPAVFAGAPVL